MKIIMISGKAESGKGVVADAIYEYLYKNNKKILVINFGDFVKFIASKYFSWDGNKDTNGRALLQKIGTEDYRRVTPTYWVDRVIDILKIYPDMWDFVIISDFRYKNELEEMKKYYNCYTIRVERKEHNSKLTGIQLLHSSETELDDGKFDYCIISNNIDEKKLKAINIIGGIVNGK